jgi:opacity protein-like surface antigen
MKRILIASVVATLFALPAFAQTTTPTTPRVDQREANQQIRIDQGVASGQLNAKETARLEAGQSKVQAKEDKAKADGVVTKKEKARLHSAQENQGKKIAKQKHDKQKAPVATPVPAAG